MTLSSEPLSLINLAVILGACGQIVAGIATVAIAYLTYRTAHQVTGQAREIRSQSQAMQAQAESLKEQAETTYKMFVAQYGPRIQLRWLPLKNKAQDTDWEDIFPDNAHQVTSLPNGIIREFCAKLAEWWVIPNRSTSRFQYLILEVKNAQDSSYGSAANVKICLEMRIKNTKTSAHPDYHRFEEVEFSINLVNAGETKRVPICVSGIPKGGLKAIVKSVTYYTGDNKQQHNRFSGETLHILGETST